MKKVMTREELMKMYVIGLSWPVEEAWDLIER
jgi:hypothetical protein